MPDPEEPATLMEARAALKAECLRRLSESVGRPVTDADLEHVRQLLAAPVARHELERVEVARFAAAVRELSVSTASSGNPLFHRFSTELQAMLQRPEFIRFIGATSERRIPVSDRSKLAFVIGRSPTFVNAGREPTKTDLALLSLALNPNSTRKIDLKYAGGINAAIDAAITAETTAMSQARTRWGRPSVAAVHKAGASTRRASPGSIASVPQAPALIWLDGAASAARAVAALAAVCPDLIEMYRLPSAVLSEASSS